MIDPEIQTILKEIGGLRQEIKSLTREIEGLTKCKNDHEERIREMEINFIDKEDHEKVLEKIDKLSLKVERALIYAFVGFTLIMVIVQYLFKVG